MQVEKNVIIQLEIDPPVHHLIHFPLVESMLGYAKHVVIRIWIRTAFHARSIMIQTHEIIAQYRLQHLAQFD
ncbi:MAG: hypothetical protein ABSA26_15605 [Thermoguttaceae bacterium]